MMVAWWDPSGCRGVRKKAVVDSVAKLVTACSKYCLYNSSDGPTAHSIISRNYLRRSLAALAKVSWIALPTSP